MFDFSLESILESNIINFAIMILFFAFLISKLDLSGKIKAAQNGVKEKIDTSDSLKEQAKRYFADILKSIENLPSEIRAILEDASKTVSNVKEKIQGEIEETKISLETNAQKIIEAEISKANSEVKKEMSAKSVEKAQGKIVQALGENSELHRKFIENSIEEFEGLNI